MHRRFSMAQFLRWWGGNKRRSYQVLNELIRTGVIVSERIDRPTTGGGQILRLANPERLIRD